MNYPTLEELLNAGVHFGHMASRWNPKMRPFIFTTRNRIHVINLEKTQEYLKRALDFVKDTASASGQVLFVGTKRQAKEEIKKAAISCGMPFVAIRWLGGTFTNFKTIQKTIRKLEKLQKLRDGEDFESKYTKKERLLIEREIQKLEQLFEGTKGLKKLPEAVFVADINHDQIAVKEAKASGIKVVGLVDTNSDPEGIDYPIPSNDDAIKSISLIANKIAEAVKEGKLTAGSQEKGEGGGEEAGK
ncbi:MAG: 30S ribosomal protein S2 [Candidatus Doudnabacteria bacterium]|nr:30S ribosomal protein S2 [Candidatus Doudnabacteria bacterium]